MIIENTVSLCGDFAICSNDIVSPKQHPAVWGVVGICLGEAISTICFGPRYQGTPDEPDHSRNVDVKDKDSFIAKVVEVLPCEFETTTWRTVGKLVPSTSTTPSGEQFHCVSRMCCESPVAPVATLYWCVNQDFL